MKILNYLTGQKTFIKYKNNISLQKSNPFLKIVVNLL